MRADRDDAVNRIASRLRRSSAVEATYIPTTKCRKTVRRASVSPLPGVLRRVRVLPFFALFRRKPLAVVGVLRWGRKK